MSAINAIQTAMQGVFKGLEGAQKNAAEIASAGQLNADENGDLIKPMVELTQHKHQVEASAKAVKVIDETIGSLLDVEA